MDVIRMPAACAGSHMHDDTRAAIRLTLASMFCTWYVSLHMCLQVRGHTTAWRSTQMSAALRMHTAILAFPPVVNPALQAPAQLQVELARLNSGQPSERLLIMSTCAYTASRLRWQCLPVRWKLHGVLTQ